MSRNANDFKLRITIEKAYNLAVADENGLSDPYAVLHIDNKKIHKTSVDKKTLDPVWNSYKDISLKIGNPMGLLEIFIWDKDKLRQAKFRDIVKLNKEAISDDFLGKIAIPVGQLFDLTNPSGRALEYDSPQNREVTLTLEKRNYQDNISGQIQIKFGIVRGPNSVNSDLAKFWEDYINQ
ncbi:C2 domain-containing protein [Pilaira anomala]|nr:C2 domain-containing protein [Pilaira anomala]